MSKKETIVLGADHAGFEIKEYIKGLLSEMSYQIEDVGTFSQDSLDYPDYAEKIALAVQNGDNTIGVLCLWHRDRSIYCGQ